jgi:aminoglycoside phosphotransferase family enzyme/predicted kinase
MDLPRLIEALSNPASYPHPVLTIEVHHTHISVVFLAGPYAYKIKKPVDLGFLDFTTLDKRHHFCNEEVRLNRRLAPSVYLGVVPVDLASGGRESAGAIEIEGSGEVVEWAVKMRRLPPEATLLSQLDRGQVNASLMVSLAQKIADFHKAADGGSHIAAFGRFDAVARNIRENFDQAASQVGVTISRMVFDRLRALNEQWLDRLRSVIGSRAARGVPRDTHGDLHLDHVYLFADCQPPDDLVIIDCIEFNERFRFADPVADMAFLAMDLIFHGSRDLARVFSDTYFQAAGDEEGRTLLPFYIAYRAAVRGKVEGFELTEKEIPEAERITALARARGHWLLALGELEEPGRKPCLVLIGGLPGTGKSTLARALAERMDFCMIRSDVVRKELAGLGAQLPASSPFGEGLYSDEWTERTYSECLQRAEKLLFEGKRVIVDASLGKEHWRLAFLELARIWCVPMVFLICRADPDVIRTRLAQRQGDASDADWAIHEIAVQRWEEMGPVSSAAVHEVHTQGAAEEALAKVIARLP